MRPRTTVSVLGTALALAAFTAAPASAGTLALQSDSGCSGIGGNIIYCSVDPTGGTGTYSACWNGSCTPYSHLYFSEHCVTNSGVSVSVTVTSGTESVSAQYTARCLGGPIQP